MDFVTELTALPFLIIDELGVQRLPHNSAEELLERNTLRLLPEDHTRAGR
jgi:hypothetical protein